MMLINKVAADVLAQKRCQHVHFSRGKDWIGDSMDSDLKSISKVQTLLDVSTEGEVNLTDHLHKNTWKDEMEVWRKMN